MWSLESGCVREGRRSKKRIERMHLGEKKGDYFVDQIRGAQFNSSIDEFRRLC